MKKKSFLVIFFILMILIILSFITNYADTARVSTNHEPKFCVKFISDDGSKVTYWGLGYKVIRYVGVSPDEPYQNNIGAKMGNWFMQYEPGINLENEPVSIHTIDDFYHTTITQNKDIRNLTKSYHVLDAQKDDCFVIGETIHNAYLYDEFMENCKNSKSSFIRVAQTTLEGDLILYDILYAQTSNQFYLVTDTTRDNFSTSENRTITLKQFENMAEYEYEGHLYWVLYNAQLTSDTFESDNVFKIATIL